MSISAVAYSWGKRNAESSKVRSCNYTFGLSCCRASSVFGLPSHNADNAAIPLTVNRALYMSPLSGPRLLRKRSAKEPVPRPAVAHAGFRYVFRLMCLPIREIDGAIHSQSKPTKLPNHPPYGVSSCIFLEVPQ